jgi:hypothetical protein
MRAASLSFSFCNFSLLALKAPSSELPDPARKGHNWEALVEQPLLVLLRVEGPARKQRIDFGAQPNACGLLMSIITTIVNDINGIASPGTRQPLILVCPLQLELPSALRSVRPKTQVEKHQQRVREPLFVRNGSSTVRKSSFHFLGFRSSVT